MLTSNNTLWQTVCDKDEVKCIFQDYVGFSGDNIYFAQNTPHLEECSQSRVINLGLISFYWATYFLSPDFSIHISGFVSSLLGIGIITQEEQWIEIRPDSVTEMIRKIDSHWKPTPAFGIIRPSTGEQSSTLTNVTLTCEYTSFEEEGVNRITFSPSNGIMVSDINVISNKTIEFDIDISVGTPLGFKSVTVIWDEGKQVIVGNNVFEVRENTN